VHDDATPDAAIVVLSAAAVEDQRWLEHVPDAARLIVVRLDRFDEERVPAHLRELNWIDHSPSDPSVAYALVVAALYSNPTLIRLEQQLEREATAWDSGRRHRDLLIDDFQRARQMSDVLDDLRADPAAQPPEPTIAFVQASLAGARRGRRRRRFWRALGLVGAMSGVLGILSVLPQIARLGHINKAAIVTAGDPAGLQDIPDWVAANAAALLVTGGGATRELGRETLVEAMNREWRVSTINLQRNLTAAVVFDHGRSDAVVHRPKRDTRLAVVDTRTTRTRWSLPLGRGKYTGIAVAPDQRTAVVVGTGVVLVDLRTHSARRLVSGGSYYSVQLASNRTAALYGPNGISVLDLARGSVRHLPLHIFDVLALESVGAGKVRVLYARTADRLVLADAVSGRTLATAAISVGEPRRGAISPDGARAVVPSRGGALWTFGIGDRPSSSGIPVPVGLVAVNWATDDRLVISSDTDGAVVMHLPRAVRLGTICREVPQLLGVFQDKTSDMVECSGRSIDAVWKLPAAPRTVPAARPLVPRSLTRGTTTLGVRGSQIRLVGADRSRASGWFSPVKERVLAVGLSHDGRRAIVGSTSGEVAILERNNLGVRIVRRWAVPDAASVAVARIDGAPYVVTTTGQRWAVPDCRGCGTDEGLIQEFKRRFSGCLTERQANPMGDEARRILDINACEPVAGA
jgi:hypothetical protein